MHRIAHEQLQQPGGGATVCYYREVHCNKQAAIKAGTETRNVQLIAQAVTGIHFQHSRPSCILHHAHSPALPLPSLELVYQVCKAPFAGS
eukprot:1158122-Pelagomonas_calceolata.AAC.19